MEEGRQKVLRCSHLSMPGKVINDRNSCCGKRILFRAMLRPRVLQLMTWTLAVLLGGFWKLN